MNSRTFDILGLLGNNRVFYLQNIRLIGKVFRLRTSFHCNSFVFLREKSEFNVRPDRFTKIYNVNIKGKKGRRCETENSIKLRRAAHKISWGLLGRNTSEKLALRFSWSKLVETLDVKENGPTSFLGCGKCRSPRK